MIGAPTQKNVSFVILSCRRPMMRFVPFVYTSRLLVCASEERPLARLTILSSSSSFPTIFRPRLREEDKRAFSSLSLSLSGALFLWCFVPHESGGRRERAVATSECSNKCFGGSSSSSSEKGPFRRSCYSLKAAAAASPLPVRARRAFQVSGWGRLREAVRRSIAFRALLLTLVLSLEQL